MNKPSPPSLSWLKVSDAQIEHANSLPPSPLDPALDEFHLVDDPNSPSDEPETEADAKRLGSIRLSRARHQSQAFRDQTRALSTSQSSTPATPTSGSPDSPSTTE